MTAKEIDHNVWLIVAENDDDTLPTPTGLPCVVTALNNTVTFHNLEDSFRLLSWPKLEQRQKEADLLAKTEDWEHTEYVGVCYGHHIHMTIPPAGQSILVAGFPTAEKSISNPYSGQ